MPSPTQVPTPDTRADRRAPLPPARRPPNHRHPGTAPGPALTGERDDPADDAAAPSPGFAIGTADEDPDDPTAAGDEPPTGGSATLPAGISRASFLEPVGIVGGIVLRVADQVRASVQPEAVQAVAQTFTFPLALMLAVLLFLFVQHRLDRRDPKLRSGPAAGAEIVIPFVEEREIP